jgi:HEPN domain-containing protein
MDSRDEAEYRLGIAREHLHRAKEELESFKRESNRIHLASCVAESQLCIENSTKAVISVFRIPSREHDPSDELREVLEETKQKMRGDVVASLEKLAGMASRVAPEHIRATYGDEERRIPPSELYEEEKAAGFLRDAGESCEIAGRFLREWFGTG